MASGPTQPSRIVPRPQPGILGRNPYGRGAPDAKARRSIGEVFRSLATAEELGLALLAIAGGVDPYEEKRKARPDGLPTLGSETIDWTTRRAALELFLAYHSGKPAQSVVVQAEIDQRIAIEGQVQTGPLDFRSMPAEVRQAFRAAALAALGRAPAAMIDAISSERDAGLELGQRSERPPAARVADKRIITVDLDEQSDGESRSSESDHAADRSGRGQRNPAVDDRGLVIPAAARVDVGQVEVQHALTVDQELAAVKGIHVDFRESTNLVDALLTEDGVCTVRFRAAGGGVARAYQYANVTPAMMTAWRDAPSAGAWFHREIKIKAKQYPVLPTVRPVPVVL
jgi:hypothetical protein